jgi:hypothetical protein
MNDDLLLNAFDDCVTRIADGETVEACLTRYPNLRDELQPMLETGLLVQRVRYEAGTIAAAQLRIERRLFDLLGPTPLSTSIIVSIAIAALLIGGIIGALLMGVFTPSEPPAPTANPVIVITATQMETTETDSPVPAAATPLPTDTPDIATETMTMAPTLTATRTSTMLPTQTVIPSTPTSGVANDAPILVIEGPVEAIDVNMITIFNQTITLERDDPVLAVIQLGDVLRIEGTQSDTTFRAIDVIFINIEVVVNDDGQVWRDSGACDNPPPDWVTDTDGGTSWLIRCTGNNSGSSGGGDGNNGSSSGEGDSDNDNDNDDDD